MISFNNILVRLTLAAIIVVAGTGCTEESFNLGQEEKTGEKSIISFRCTEMLEVYKGKDNYASRAGGSKQPEEQAIKTLHVFFFDKNGKLLEGNNYNNFYPYQFVANESFIKVPDTSADKPLFNNPYDDVHIVAIANIDATDIEVEGANRFKTQYSLDGKISNTGRTADDEPLLIENYTDLQRWVYYPRIRMGESEITKLPDAGMPMIGELEHVDLTQKPADTYIVKLTALMAKVNFSISLEPDQFTDQFPQLKITEYGVKNMPIAVPFNKPEGERTPNENSADKPSTYAQYLNSYDVTDAPMYHSSGEPSTDPEDYNCKPTDHEYTTTQDLPVTINKDSEPVTFSYYTYENINMPDYAATRPSVDADGNPTPAFNDDLTPNYPVGVTEERQKQRWKPTIAYTNRASALIIKGEYTTHQQLTYKAQFTFYLGKNSTDFMVERNHRYDNNITIKGLEYIRNSQDEVFNFDARVNVVDDNPFYLAIVNELNVDAHATALPMDVWFMHRETGQYDDILEETDWDSQITFTIRDHNGANNWLRMEKVTRDQMIGQDANGNPRFIPGSGVRQYFYTDLLTTDLNQEENWKMVVDAEVDKSRSRIYFYIDENVPETNDVTEAQYHDRTATIDVLYERFEKGTKNLIEKRERTLDIRQRALIKVESSYTYSYYQIFPPAVLEETVNSTSWMEYSEEYLYHNDPLEERNESGEFYKGLPWGLEGINCLNGFNNTDPNGTLSTLDSYQIYTPKMASSMTQWAINQSEVSIADDTKIYNETKPHSAFHYCFGKNRRDRTGNVPTGAQGYWYMPSIRELETALVNNYSKFEEFRGDLYWSAACAQRDNSNTHARATGIQSVTAGGTANYYDSSPNGGTNNAAGPGYLTRDTPKRIRAFYKIGAIGQ